MADYRFTGGLHVSFIRPPVQTNSCLQHDGTLDGPDVRPPVGTPEAPESPRRDIAEAEGPLKTAPISGRQVLPPPRLLLQLDACNLEE